RVSWTVWMTFFSVIGASRLRGEDVPQGALGVGVRRVPRRLHLDVDQLLDLGARPIEPLVVDEALLLQVGAELRQRVVASGLLHLLARAIRPVVVVGG